MNISFYINCLILASVFVILTSCQAEERDDGMGSIEGEGIAAEGLWARPGSEGRMSAGYFLLTNFEDEPDTLTGVSSDVARLTEMHESYEQEGGMMGMRQADYVVIPPQSTVSFEPGGLHIMFIELTQELAEGEEFTLTLHFAGGGDLQLTVPVRN